ncbi:MAG: DUF362 domain-containing protein, partial [Candidatus Omnitrophica bacterium]|nr:DUF362 domain-containing protein [Candidatus Omnitrophota bacterium]
KLKTHHFTILSGAIKNLFGLVPGTYKTELHKNNFTVESFSRMLVDVYELTKPTLTIVDGILAMEGNGPGTSGKPRQANLLLAGDDAVAIDSILARVIGVEPLDILTTKEAARRGLGSVDINSITVLGADLEKVIKEPFLLPSASLLRKKIPKLVIKIVKKFIRYYPYARKNKCIRCGACVKACPEKIITMKKKSLYFYYPKCIACFCCQEVCPAAAIDIRRSFLAKLIGL